MRNGKVARCVFLCAMFLSCCLWVGLLISFYTGHCDCRSAVAQQNVWYDKGRFLFGDYSLTWQCARTGYVTNGCERVSGVNGCPLQIRQQDRGYLPFSFLPFRVLPHSIPGAVAYVGFASVLLVLSIFLNFRKENFSSLFALAMSGMTVLTGTFLFSAERGNSILFAAAFLSFFFLWFDDDSIAKREMAIGCLVLATCLKIAPAILIVLMFYRGRLKAFDYVVWPCAGAALSLAPFFWYGGAEGFGAWLSCVTENGQEMGLHAAMGFMPFVRCVMPHIGLDWMRDGLLWVTFTRVIGIVFVVAARFGKDRSTVAMLAIIGMIYAAGNMMLYGGLYLLPVFAMRFRRMDLIEALLWFAVFTPLQLPYREASLNELMISAAIWGLAILAVTRNLGRRARDSGDTNAFALETSVAE